MAVWICKFDGNLDAGSPPTEAMINGAFTAAPPEELVQLVASIDAGLSALKTIESAMVAKQGVQAAPDTGPVSGLSLNAC